MDDFDLRYTALRRTVIENEYARLNEMQRKAVLKTEGPLLRRLRQDHRPDQPDDPSAALRRRI